MRDRKDVRELVDDIERRAEFGTEKEFRLDEDEMLDVCCLEEEKEPYDLAWMIVGYRQDIRALIEIVREQAQRIAELEAKIAERGSEGVAE